MSRCFPYDPLPRDVEQSGALIESIKTWHHHFMDVAYPRLFCAGIDGIYGGAIYNLQKKAKRGEKRKREKKHKKCHGVVLDEMVNDVNQCHMHWKHVERNVLDGESHRHPNQKDESEQLERSGLTEENVPPCVRSTRREDSPDNSSHYSCKRVDGPTDLNRVSNGNLLLRIKVPGQRPKEPDQPTKPRELDQPTKPWELDQPTKPWELDQPTKPRELDQPTKPRELDQPTKPQEPEPPGPIPIIVPEPPSSSGRTESVALEQQPCLRPAQVGLFGEPIEGFRGSRRSRKRGAKYEGLFGSLCLPPLRAESFPPDDEDWLLGPRKAKQQDGDTTRLKHPEANISVDPSSLSAWPPKACYLPEADLHMLPFVVPF